MKRRGKGNETTRGERVRVKGFLGFSSNLVSLLARWTEGEPWRGGPWCLDHALLVLEEPTGKGELTKMRFDRVMFWIQIHNTPLLCMNKETCSFLGSLIGEVVEVDSSMAGVSSPNEVLLNVGGSGGTVVLEKSGDCVVQVEVGKGRQKLAHGLLLHGGSEHLSDKCDAQEGKQNHSGPSIAHGNSGRPHFMRTLFWNVRGLGSDRIVHVLHKYLQEINPDVVFLSKTITDTDRMEVLIVRLGFLVTYHVNKVWRLTGFYGNPNASQRIHSWTLLRRLRGLSSLPWLCGGDFNEILSDSEKMGGSFRLDSLIRNFRSLLYDCDLFDLGFRGPSFTWSNKQEGSNLIQERLDRCLCDLSWHCLFGESKVTNLGFWRSDHRPILLEVLEHPSPAPQVASLRGRRFHFEACWADSDVCKDIIKSAWANPGSDWVGFLQNIEGCTSHLARSRVAWLRSGDRNTKFFHSCASARRATNKIAELCDIEHIIVDYFSRIFQKSNSGIVDCQGVLDCVECCLVRFSLLFLILRSLQMI
ncbi:hypothetical protein ACOSQ4_023358 [Xanthoceras sorbifolium]